MTHERLARDRLLAELARIADGSTDEWARRTARDAINHETEERTREMAQRTAPPPARHLRDIIFGGTHTILPVGEEALRRIEEQLRDAVLSGPFVIDMQPANFDMDQIRAVVDWSITPRLPAEWPDTEGHWLGLPESTNGAWMQQFWSPFGEHSEHSWTTDQLAHDDDPDRCWRCDARRGTEERLGLCEPCHLDLAPAATDGEEAEGREDRVER